MTHARNKMAFAVLALGLFQGLGAAQAEQIKASGCARAGTEAGCIILQDGDKTYDITSASPKPAVDTYGTVTGTISSKMTMCMEGKPLEAAEWKPDPTKACTN